MVLDMIVLVVNMGVQWTHYMQHATSLFHPIAEI